MSDLLNQASLVMVPSGYKEDTVYSVVPTDGSGDLSFTRASNGTRINSAGLVEVCPWNLLEYSEDFANAWWQKDPGSSVDSNVATAPNGTSTADRLNYTAAGQGIYRVISFSGTNKLSVYLKGEGANIGKQIQLEIGAIGGFNVTLTGDWVRHEVEASNATSVAIKKATSGQADAVLAWGIQVNSGSTAKPYFPTTDRLNVPRLTYQNGGGGCPSLLLEKQSTNLQYYSQQFDLWSNASDLTVSANATTSPDGTQNADKLNENSSNGYHIIGDSNFNSTAGTTYTMSFFAKASERSYARILAPASSYNTDYAYFDLTNGSVSVSSGTASMQSMGNGWYRCVWSLAAVSTSGGIGMWIGPARNMTDAYNTYTGTSGSGIFVYGAQLEASSYPTSYIPTTSSSATRVADDCFKTGISSLIGQTEGAFMIDVNLDVRASFTYFAIASSLGSVSNYIGVGIGAGSIDYEVVVSGVVQAGINLANSSTGRFKIAAAYKANDFVLYINGTQIGTDTSGSVPTCSEISLFNYSNNQPLKYNQVAIFKTRLSNSELQSLTI